MINKIAFFIDEIFKLIIFFFISLIFFRATNLSLGLSLLLSSIVTIILCVIFYIIRTKRLTKKQLSLTQLKEIDKLKDQFSYGSQIEIRNYLKKLFNAEKNYKNELTIDNKDTIILYNFDNKVLDCEEIKKIYRENKNRKIHKIIILCNSYSLDCKNLIKNFQKIKYEIIDISELYVKYILPEHSMPNFAIETIPKEKFNFNTFKKYAFSRHKSKTYFLCGLVLLFSSYFVPLRIYYLIFSALMFISSLLCIILNTKKVNI